MLDQLDLIGVFIASCSGALLAARKEMDALGFIILGIVTGIGGGTLRDLTLGVPVFWVENQSYLIVSFIASMLAFSLARRPWGGRRQAAFLWLDASAMAVFSATGSMKALSLDAPWMVVILMGVFTAIMGGLMRDVIAQDTPFVMRGEIFAIAATIGAAICLLVYTISGDRDLSMIAAMIVALAVRASAIAFGLRLHVGKREE